MCLSHIVHDRTTVTKSMCSTIGNAKHVAVTKRPGKRRSLVWKVGAQSPVFSLETLTFLYINLPTNIIKTLVREEWTCKYLTLKVIRTGNSTRDHQDS